MDIFSSLILFAIFIVIYVVIIEVFTVLFRLTGLTEDKARFQVISMLTNSGFTTSESELFVVSKRRRTLTSLTMIFGHSFTVIIVSVVINLFLALPQAAMHRIVVSAIVVVFLFTLIYISINQRWIKTAFDRFIENIGNRLMFGKGSNPVVLLDTYGNNVMAEIVLTNMPQELIDVPMKHSKLKEKYGIQVILIKRNNEPVEIITGDTILLNSDMIVVFGSHKNIRLLFENPVEHQTSNAV